MMMMFLNENAMYLVVHHSRTSYACHDYKNSHFKIQIWQHGLPDLRFHFFHLKPAQNQCFCRLWTTFWGSYGWRTTLVDFLLALAEFVSLSITVLKLGGEMFVSQGSTYLYSTFTWTGSSLSNILGIRKLQTLDYPMVKTFCVSSFWHNTGVWRTDRQTDELPVAHTALAKLTLPRCENCYIRYMCLYAN